MATRPSVATSIALLAALALPATGSAASAHAVKITLNETAISYTPGPTADGPPSFAVEAGVVSGSLGLGADRTEIEFFDGGHMIRGQGTFAFLERHLRWPTPK